MSIEYTCAVWGVQFEPSTDKWVLMSIADQTRPDGSMVANATSIRYLEVRTGYSKATLVSSLRRLREYGVLISEEVKNGSKARYRISLEKLNFGMSYPCKSVSTNRTVFKGKRFNGQNGTVSTNRTVPFQLIEHITDTEYRDNPEPDFIPPSAGQRFGFDQLFKSKPIDDFPFVDKPLKDDLEHDGDRIDWRSFGA